MTAVRETSGHPGDELHLESEVLGEVGKLHQYGGFWAIREAEGTALWNRIRQTDLAAHIATEKSAAAGSTTKTVAGGKYTLLDGGIAVVSMAGVMTKYGSSMSMMRDGSIGVRRALRGAAADRDVKAIVLRVDSPGGAVSGTGALAEDVARIAAKKPVIVYIDDLAASAAYYVASQATRIVANKDALVGSIGVYMVVDDFSAFYAQKGIKTHVVKAGKFKAAGVEGTEITAEQLANWQREVDGINELFVSAVARGRRISKAQAAELADGRVHTAAEAKAMGLIDAVGTIDEVIAEAGGTSGSLLIEAVAEVPPRRKDAAVAAQNKGGTMEGSNGTQVQAADVKAPKAATLSDLKSAFPDSDAVWREGCLELGLTMEQAKDKWIKHLGEKTKAAEERAAKAEKDAAEAKAAPRKMGVPIPGSGKAATASEGNVDPITAFDALVREKMKGGMERLAAVASAAKANSELHKQYLLATNSGRKTQRIIEEKYDTA